MNIRIHAAMAGSMFCFCSLSTITIQASGAASKYAGRVERSGAHARVARPASIETVAKVLPVPFDWKPDELQLHKASIERACIEAKSDNVPPVPSPTGQVNASAQPLPMAGAAVTASPVSGPPAATALAATATAISSTAAQVDYGAVEKAYADAIPAPVVIAKSVSTLPPNPSQVAAVNYGAYFNYLSSGAAPGTAARNGGNVMQAVDVDNCACAAMPGIGQSASSITTLAMPAAGVARPVGMSGVVTATPRR